MRRIGSPLRGIRSPFPRATGFSALSIFANGEVGQLIEVDTSRLYTDLFAETLLTAAGQQAGTHLDISQGLSIGAEISLLSSATITDATGNLTLVNPVPASNRYSATMTLSGATANRRVRFQSTFNGVTATTPLLTADGTYSYAIPADVSTFFRINEAFVGGDPGSISATGISVKELRGNHLAQATSTFRPVYNTGPARLTYDGGDDRLNAQIPPTTSGSFAVRFIGTTASRVMIGSQGATDGRCFMGLAADGSLAGGIGTQGTTTIKDTVDVRNVWTTGVLTWDGSTVTLYRDGVQVYSAAQSGTVNTTVNFDHGALNANGTRSAFWAGSIGAALAVNRVLTPAEVAGLHKLWSSIA